MLKDLTKRSEEPELMDDFREGLERLKLVYNDINRVNSILGGNHITINGISDLIRRSPQDEYTIVDMGCGDGQMLREVARFCRKKKLKAKLIGVDVNEEALQLAEEASLDYDEISYLHFDILKLDATTLNCDILINTLTMHHFPESTIMAFLHKFIDLVKVGVVINDLHRSRRAYYLFKLFSLVGVRTSTARIDGLISISKGFVKSDLIRYSKKISTMHHDIKWKWAFRYRWIMRPK